MWPWFYHLTVSIFRIAFRIRGDIKVKGRDRLPAKGPYIVAPNHVSYVDPPIVGAALPGHSYYMAKAELFSVPVLGKIIPRIGAFPIRRGSPDRAAVKVTLALLAAGEPVTIFPEGTRRPVGELGEAESGFGWLVHRARVPVVPIGIVGAGDLLPRGARFIQHSQVRVHIGEPLTFEDLLDSPDSRAAIKEIGIRTMAAIRQLMETADV